MKNKMKKGFTLVELMIVVAIMGILAAVSAPRLGDQIRKARDGKGLAIVGALRSASMINLADNDGVAATSTAALIAEIDSQSQGEVTTSGALVYVLVGTNTTAQGVTIDGSTVTIELDDPDEDGVIDISSDNGNDTKNNAWDEY